MAKTPEQYAAELRAEAAERAQREGMVSALEAERRGYVQREQAAKVRGDKELAAAMKDRQAQVDAQLARFADPAGDAPAGDDAGK